MDFSSMPSLQWFLEVYPMLAEDERPLEMVQHPGEVVYVPSGWWHIVLNLEETVSVTQNFVDQANLPTAVRDIVAHEDTVPDGLLDVMRTRTYSTLAPDSLASSRRL